MLNYGLWSHSDLSLFDSCLSASARWIDGLQHSWALFLEAGNAWIGLERELSSQEPFWVGTLGLLLFKVCIWPANEGVWWHQAILKDLDDIKGAILHLKKGGSLTRCTESQSSCLDLLHNLEQWTEFLCLARTPWTQKAYFQKRSGEAAVGRSLLFGTQA